MSGFEGDVEVHKKLREALSKLVVSDMADSTSSMQASEEVFKLSRHPSFLSSLFCIVAKDDAIEIRRKGAEIFEKMIHKLWKSIDDSNRLAIREATLKRLQEESDPVVRNSVMEMVGGIAKQELANNRPWEEVGNFVTSSVCSGNELEMECGTQVLKIICENSAGYLTEHHCGILTLIDEVLKLSKTPNTWQYAVQAFNFLVPYLGDKEEKFVSPLVPKSVEVIKIMLDSNMESKAPELIELFERLIETKVSFIAQYVRDLVEFVLHVAGNNNFENKTRSKVMTLIRLMFKKKKRAILKHDLLGQILNVICPLMEPTDEDNELGFIGNSEDLQTPHASALYVVNDMALHFPPEKLYANIMPYLDRYANVANKEDCVRQKRALQRILGCLVEGTAEFIKSTHLKTFLEIVCKGVKDPNTYVSGDALFALGQFTEHLQPDINQFASDIMLMLFKILGPFSNFKEGFVLAKAYYALENFLKNLESGIIPNPAELMLHLLGTPRATSDLYLNELVICTIGAVANATSKEFFFPYLDYILPMIRHYLFSITQFQDDDQANIAMLHTPALDTLAVLVRTLEEDPRTLCLAEDAIKLELELIGWDKTDPDLRRAAYGLFAAVSSVVGENTACFLGDVVKYMINSIKCNKNILANSINESKICAFSNISTETDCDGIDQIWVNDIDMVEKIEAIVALGAFAKHSRKSFQFHIRSCFFEVFKLYDLPYPDIRKSAISTLGQFLTSAYQSKNEFYDEMLAQTFPVLVRTVNEDPELFVVMVTIMTFKEVIEVCGGDAFQNQEVDLKTFMSTIFGIIQQQSACQDGDNGGEGDQQAEYDKMLVKYCIEILPILNDKLNFMNATIFTPNDYSPLLYPFSKLESFHMVYAFEAKTKQEAFEGLISRDLNELNTVAMELKFSHISANETLVMVKRIDDMIVGVLFNWNNVYAFCYPRLGKRPLNLILFQLQSKQFSALNIEANMKCKALDLLQDSLSVHAVEASRWDKDPFCKQSSFQCTLLKNSHLLLEEALIQSKAGEQFPHVDTIIRRKWLHQELTFQIMWLVTHQMTIPGHVFPVETISYIVDDKQPIPDLNPDLLHLTVIVGPYLKNGCHFNLFLVHVPSKMVYLLDPCGIDSDMSNKAAENWGNCLKNLMKCDTTWVPKYVDHPLQTDSFNCGIIVLEMAELILSHLNTTGTMPTNIDFNTSKKALENQRWKYGREICRFCASRNK